MGFRFTKLLEAIRAGNSTPSVPSFYFNFSNPSNVTLGAAQARGNITSTQNAHITMSASLSRVVGVAPLYVNIDMTGTTSDLTANATHDLFYSVNWGDPGAGQWANGVQSAGLTDKNWSFGPVGGHVFETPGTYLVTPTSTDGVNSAAKPGYVTVLDPNDVYDPAYGAGYETICISNSNNFTGAPGTGALPGVATYINRSGDTDMYAAWNTYKASKKRILFCKSDSWTISATISASGLSNMVVGGYGTGVNHTFSSGTMVSATAALLANPVFSSSGSSDVRFCNFRVDASASVAFGASSADDSQVTWYKMEARNASSAFSLSANLVANSLFKHDQACIYECLHDDAYGYAGIDTPAFTGATASNGGGFTPCIFTATGHNFKRVNKIRLVGTLPTGFATLTDYYISATNLTANTFSLTASPSVDTPLTSSSTGTCDVNAVSLGGGVGAFATTTRGGIMGNYFDNCNHGEQVMRCQYIHSSHINNNYFARPNQTKNILKINSRGYGNIITVPGVSGWTEKIVIAANFFDMRDGYAYNQPIPDNGKTATALGSSYMIIQQGGSGEGQVEYLRNFIVENNYTRTCLGSPKSGDQFAELSLPNVTLRNNILDATYGDRSSPYDADYVFVNQTFVTISPRTDDPVTGVRIYNNTLYSNIRNAEVACFARALTGGANGEVDNLKIQNNIWYTPHATTEHKESLYLGTGAAPTNVTNTNNTDSVTGGSPTTSPNFVATPPVLLTDWRTTSGYAINKGATVPVLRDFNNASRYGGTYDLGAVLP